MSPEVGERRTAAAGGLYFAQPPLLWTAWRRWREQRGEHRRCCLLLRDEVRREGRCCVHGGMPGRSPAATLSIVAEEVLYKSRCDNWLNEITERTLADKPEVRANRIQSDLEELLKALTERCKKHSVTIKSTALIELPHGLESS
nr:epidermal growth factor receptor substrate 15-like 1 isoform X2 [Ipomoea trifida]